MRSLIPVTLILLLSACSARPQVVPSLSPSTQAQVNQNLKNGRLPAPSEVANNSVPTTPDACEQFRATIPTNWFQDTIEVPENPAEPLGTKIKVFYYGLIKPGTVPTIFYNGGPGSDSHSSASDLNDRDEFFDPDGKISFIYMDQRGTGCSDFYPQGSSQATLDRLRYYGSRGIVSDSEYLRQKLIGDRPWIAFGQSFGALVSHRYVVMAPQFLKAALAHGNAIDSNGNDRIEQRIASQVRVMNDYLTEYPADRQLLQTMKTALTPKTCFTSQDKSQTLCGYQILEVIAEDLLGFTDYWLTLHDWIGLMATSKGLNNEGITRFLATFAFGEGNPLDSERWADLVIGWVDRDVPPFDTYHCQMIQKDLLAQGVDLSQSLSNECMYALQVPDSKVIDTSLVVQNLPRDLLTVGELYDSLKAHPELSFFLYSGEQDPYVPVANFKEEVSQISGLSNVHYTDFAGTGHDGYETEPQVWNDLISQSKE